MIAIDTVLEHYRDVVECLRLVHLHGIADIRFAGLTQAQLSDRLAEVRVELDRQTVLALVTSAEATIRLDFMERLIAGPRHFFLLRRLAFKLRLPPSWWQRLGSLEERFCDLEVRYGKRVPLEEILAAWKMDGADAHKVGAFKPILRHRHWLAHGRYFPDKSGYAVPPAPPMIHGAIGALFAELKKRRADFPRP
ncbi:MAG: hypothetical protein JNL21_23335 [Myxococcales bacterium]|nr:hypothetical protein [Myxococcales bacterium]